MALIAPTEFRHALTADRDDAPAPAAAAAASPDDLADDEDARTSGELLLAGAAACFALIPHVLGVVVAINGMICHLCAAHGSAMAVPAAIWDSLVNVLVVVYVTAHACSRPVTSTSTVIALLGILAVAFAPSPRIRAAAHFGLVQVPCFMGLLFFALSC